MEIRFNGRVPEEKTYKAGVMGNSLVDSLIFTLDNEQDGILLSGYKPYLKISEPIRKYGSYIDKDPYLEIISSEDENKLQLRYVIPRKAASHKSLNMQLQFEYAESEEVTEVIPENEDGNGGEIENGATEVPNEINPPVWQSEIFTVVFADTINADKYVADSKPAILQDHEKRILNIEKNGVAAGGQEGGSDCNCGGTDTSFLKSGKISASSAILAQMLQDEGLDVDMLEGELFYTYYGETDPKEMPFTIDMLDEQNNIVPVELTLPLIVEKINAFFEGTFTLLPDKSKKNLHTLSYMLDKMGLETATFKLIFKKNDNILAEVALLRATNPASDFDPVNLDYNPMISGMVSSVRDHFLVSLYYGRRGADTGWKICRTRLVSEDFFYDESEDWRELSFIPRNGTVWNGNLAVEINNNRRSIMISGFPQDGDGGILIPSGFELGSVIADLSIDPNQYYGTIPLEAGAGCCLEYSNGDTTWSGNIIFKIEANYRATLSFNNYELPPREEPLCVCGGWSGYIEISY